MKRFWSDVHLVAAESGWGLCLDARPLKTPARAALVVPTHALAEALAAEWSAQGEDVDPTAMPLTRAANVAIDRVGAARAEIEAMLAGYGETDLLCYRAPHPPALAERQRARWDPLLDWAEATYGARLVPVEGVMFAPQDAAALARLGQAVAAHDVWELTALYDLVSLSGSLVLGLAASHGRLDEAEAWALSRLDEDWNIEQWGEDAEAAAQAAHKRADFAQAMRLLELVRGSRVA
ncbi:MAG: ATP12 family protein [Pseudomonadota bacterium]